MSRPDVTSANKIPPPARSAASLFQERAAGHPADPAIRWRGRTITYADLSEASASVASDLLRRGLNPFDVVAVEGVRSPGVVASMLGVMLAGGVVLPLDRRLPSIRKRTMLRLARATRLLVVGSQPDRWWEDAGAPVALLDVDEATGAVDGLAIAGSAGPLPCVRLDSPAYIFFTSGSTGEPKGVVGHHKGLAHFLNWQRRTFSIGPGDRVANLAPLSFDVFLRDVFLPLTSGATLSMPDDETVLRSAESLEWLAAESVSVIHVTPSFARLWLAGRRGGGAGAWRPRWVFFSGEPLTGSLVARWREAVPSGEIVNLYGPTETCMVKSWYRVPRDPGPGVQPIGRAIPGSDLVVVDPEGRPCAAGQAGEITIRTAFGTLGYLSTAPESDRARFRMDAGGSDPGECVYHTGDLGRRRADGVLDILGRIDHQLNVRGMRVEPEEIEGALETHPGVRHAAVAARSSGPDDVSLVAYLVGDSVSPAELRSHLRQRIASPLVPDRFTFVDALPVLPNGKIDRRALSESEVAGIEEIAGICREVLDVQVLDPDEDLADLGCHSLNATAITARIRDRFGVAVPPTALLRSCTVRRLWDLVRYGGREDDEPMGEPGARGCSTIPLSVAQLDIWLSKAMEPASPAFNEPFTIDLTEGVDAAALGRALQCLVDRHEILRTAFHVENGSPVQRVLDAAALTLRIVDLSGVPCGERMERASAIALEEATRRFDLSRPPLLRATLVRLGPAEARLYVTAHHLVVDAYSFYRVFAPELDELHTALRDGREPALAPRPCQYADYVAWQQGVSAGAEFEEQMRFWTQHLLNARPLAPAVDRSRYGAPTFAGASERLEILGP